MSFKTTKLKWAKKLLKAKMFIVMTEKESAIAIDGADPYSFTDALALAAQSAELEMFYDSLGKLIKEHQAALETLSGGTDEVEVKKPVTANRKVNSTKNAKARKSTRSVPAKPRTRTTKATKAKK